MSYAGLWAAIGSYIFIEVFRDGYEERKRSHKNMLGCTNVFFRNDELIAVWCFIIGE